MGRFTGWLALIVLLGGLGYVMYEDLKLRREHAAESTVASGEAPTSPVPSSPPEEVASAEAPVPPPAAVRAVPADEPAAGPADVAPTGDDSAVAASDTAAPVAPADEPTPQDASNPAPEPATPTVDSVADTGEPAADAPPPVTTAEAPPSVDAAPPADAPPTPEAAATTPEAPEPEPPALAEAEPPAVTTPEPVAPAVAAEIPPAASVDDAPDGAKAPAPVTEARSSAGSEDDAPVAAAEPAAAADGPLAEETAIAAAPEGTPGTPEGDRAPVSESSDLDHTLQAAAEPVPEPETATETDSEAETEAETVVAAVDPGADVDAPPPPGEPAPLQPGAETETATTVPTFDVVRVEPTGDAVMAGVAAPGAEIEILSGASTVATATASAAGEWAIALEEPLAAGPHDLAIRATTEDGTTAVSEQRVAIVVPEAAAEEPLVVLNTPDGPSTVLQVPAAGGTAPAGEPEAPATAPAVITDAGPTASDGASPVADAGAAAPAATETADSADSEPPATTTAESAPPAPSGETEVAVNAPPASAPEPAADAGGNGEAAAPVADGSETPGSTADAPAPAEPEVAVVAEPEPAPEPEPEPITPVVVVTAVEAETSGALFVAGTAVTPEIVRVYLDDLLLGEATPSPSGTWLLEIAREMPAGTYDVRADQIEAGSGTVIARAEVPFEREIDVAILTPVAEAGGAAGAEATGNLAGPTTVIIKRSDNLWRISRQLYGKGVRWSTIYQANKDQIRNPRWIYPGQVFVLPEGNVEWVDEQTRAAAE